MTIIGFAGWLLLWIWIFFSGFVAKILIYKKDNTSPWEPLAVWVMAMAVVAFVITVILYCKKIPFM